MLIYWRRFCVHSSIKFGAELGDSSACLGIFLLRTCALERFEAKADFLTQVVAHKIDLQSFDELQKFNVEISGSGSSAIGAPQFEKPKDRAVDWKQIVRAWEL